MQEEAERSEMKKLAKTELEAASKGVESVYELKPKDFSIDFKTTIRHSPPHPQVVPMSLAQQHKELQRWYAETGNDPTLEDEPAPCKGMSFPEYEWKLKVGLPLCIDAPVTARRVATMRRASYRSTSSWDSNDSAEDVEDQRQEMTGASPFHLGWI